MWSVIGALSQVCDLPVTTAVTCPTVRIHPVDRRPGRRDQRGAARGPLHPRRRHGEALNEHVLGDAWPTADVRLEMLEEAVGLMRELWRATSSTTDGRHYTVDTARIYTLPDAPPPIYVSGFGPKATELAARIGDGYITTSPDPTCSTRFREAGGRQAGPGRGQGLLGADRGRGRRDRPPALGQQPACPASSRRCCPHPGTSSRRPSW